MGFCFLLLFICLILSFQTGFGVWENDYRFSTKQGWAAQEKLCGLPHHKNTSMERRTSWAKGDWLIKHFHFLFNLGSSLHLGYWVFADFDFRLFSRYVMLVGSDTENRGAPFWGWPQEEEKRIRKRLTEPVAIVSLFQWSSDWWLWEEIWCCREDWDLENRGGSWEKKKKLQYCWWLSHLVLYTLS